VLGQLHLKKTLGRKRSVLAEDELDDIGGRLETSVVQVGKISSTFCSTGDFLLFSVMVIITGNLFLASLADS
jgi:hypothetical protein